MDRNKMRRRLLGNRRSGGGFPVTGLVSMYKFDESTGLAIDSINGHNGTCTNITRPVTGKIGTAYQFNGNSSVEIPDNDSHSMVGATTDLPFSVSFWFRTSSTASQVIIARRGGPEEWQISYSGGQLFLQLYSNGSVSHRISAGYPTSLINSDTWYHVVFRYDGSAVTNGIQVFVNGTQYTTPLTETIGTYVKMSNTTSTTIFGSYRKTSNFLSGQLDEFNIYKNHYLTNSEIATLYNNGNGTTL